jgi:hypothetical protein
LPMVLALVGDSTITSAGLRPGPAGPAPLAAGPPDLAFATFALREVVGAFLGVFTARFGRVAINPV